MRRVELDHRGRQRVSEHLESSDHHLEKALHAGHEDQRIGLLRALVSIGEKKGRARRGEDVELHGAAPDFEVDRTDLEGVRLVGSERAEPPGASRRRSWASMLVLISRRMRSMGSVMATAVDETRMTRGVGQDVDGHSVSTKPSPHSRRRTTASARRSANATRIGLLRA